jgi:hypothetical protein
MSEHIPDAALSRRVDPTRLAEIRARLEAASKWMPQHCDYSVDDDGYVNLSQGARLGDSFIVLDDRGEGAAEDWLLAANAPADLAYLLAALDAAQAEGQDHSRFMGNLSATLGVSLELSIDEALEEVISLRAKHRTEISIKAKAEAERDAAAARAEQLEAEATALRALNVACGDSVIRIGKELDAAQKALGEQQAECVKLRAEVARLGPECEVAWLKGKSRVIRVVQDGAPHE